MKIVIEIDDSLYANIINTWEKIHPQMWDAIKNGTPLPEHHGRLIDADELKTMSYEVLVDTDNPNRADGLSACNGLVEDDIDLAPTIIEGSESKWKL